MIDALPSALFHPHVAASGPAAEAALSVASHFDQRKSGDGLGDVARRLIDLVVASEVTGVVVGQSGLDRGQRPYGALLDADEDNLETGDMLCFEMDALMQDKRLAAPVLAHLFTKLEARFDGRPTMLILDEAWLFLDHPMFAGRLRDWLKTLRKKNVSVVFATQSLSDIAASAIAPSLIESAPTRIFLANARAEEPSQRAAYQGFGLNARQVELIARATPKQDYYVQTPDGNRLFDLDLGPVALAFCAAGSKADQKLISEILASVGPEGFAPAWLETHGLHWAADLIGTEEEMPCAAE